MHKLIHMTDPHVVCAGGRVLGLNPATRFRAALESVLSDYADAEGCVITGDLTDTGDAEEYFHLKALLAGLKMPIHMTLGNHDKRSSFFASFPQANRDSNGFAQDVFSVGDAVCILLDTLDEWHPAAGALCEKRLAWFAQRLEENRDRRAIVFMHHPPFSVGLAWFDSMLVCQPDADRFWKIVEHVGNVRHIVFGHVHASVSGSIRGVSFSGSRGTCHKTLGGGDASMVSFVEAPPAFNVLTIDDHAIHVHGVDHVGTERVIAREVATPDGSRILELLSGGAR